MIQKLFLFFILILNLLSLLFIVKIKSNFSQIIVAREGQENNVIPTFTHNKSSAVLSQAMPKIWENLADRGITKLFLSFDAAEESRANELTRWMENTPVVSAFISDKKNDYKKIDDESKKALSKMDVFVILYSSNFASSKITNQEYGIATAHDVPIIVLITNEEDKGDAESYGDILMLTEESKSHIAEAILQLLTNKRGETIKSTPEKISN